MAQNARRMFFAGEVVGTTKEIRVPSGPVRWYDRAQAVGVILASTDVVHASLVYNV